jgi:hypothetical protein
MAFHLMSEQRYWFDTEEFLAWESCWREMDKARQVLPLLWQETGICTKSFEGEGEWRFSHPILRDVLAAKYIVDRTDDALEVLSRQARDVFDTLWLRTCESTQDASPLIEKLLERSPSENFGRETLLAQAVVNNVALDRRVLVSAIDLLRLRLTELDKVVEIVNDEIEEASWTLSLRSMDKRTELNLDGLGLLLKAIVGGGGTERKLEIAERWAQAGGILVASIARRLPFAAEVSLNVEGVENSILKITARTGA